MRTTPAQACAPDDGGLAKLRHIRDVSDEQVVAQFPENAYYQYFCGMESFVTSAPCASSELVRFRHRIGDGGIGLILKESIRVDLAVEGRKREGEDRRRGEGQTAFMDTTVQEKDVTSPTDSKLPNKVIELCRKAACEAGGKVRQSYVREVKGLKLTQRFRGRAHSKDKVAKADRRCAP